MRKKKTKKLKKDSKKDNFEGRIRNMGIYLFGKKSLILVRKGKESNCILQMT